MTRKSTPKYNVVHHASDVVAIEGVSKTDATKMAREMSADRPGTFMARPAPVCRRPNN
jgi:hypothetical protein